MAVTVRLLQRWPPFNTGELVGVSAAEADRLIALGAAEMAAAPEAVKAPERPPRDKMVRQTKKKKSWR